MGQLFSGSGLTNQGSALIDPNSGNPTYIGSPQQVLGQTRNLIANAENAPNPLSMQAPDNSSLPKIGKPSFQQAASEGAMPGGMNAASPGLNKAGKLVALLTSGLQGALAGRAANEQATVQSGGRRSGGAGMGFEAGYMLPWQRAQAAQKLEQGQAGLQPIETPYGPMAAEYASRAILPAFIRAGAQEQAAQTGAQSREQVAQTGAQARTQAALIGQRFKAVPNVGLYDTQSGQMIPGTQQGIVITPDIAKDYQLPQSFIGKPLSLQNLASIQRSSVFQDVPEMTATGPIVIDRRTAKAVPVSGPGGQQYAPPALATPVQVADPNNPGQTIMVPRGQTTGMAGAQSASVAVPKKAMASEVPTKIGDLKVAFNTAIQHAELLRQAAGALQSGDTQILNKIGNTFNNAFGESGPITAQAIADAYNREVTSVVSKGHMTNEEIASVGRTLDPLKQSPQQINGVLNAYQSLMQSKLNMLNQQKNAAIQQSQPTKGGKKNDPLGIR